MIKKRLAIITFTIGILFLVLGFVSVFLYSPVENSSVDTISSVNISNSFSLKSETNYTITLVGRGRAWGDISGILYIYNDGGVSIKDFSILEYFDGDSSFSTMYTQTFTVPYSGEYYMEFHPSEFVNYGEIRIELQEGMVENTLNLDVGIILLFGFLLIAISIVLFIANYKSQSKEIHYISEDQPENHQDFDQTQTIYCSNCGAKVKGAYCDKCGFAIEE